MVDLENYYIKTRKCKNDLGGLKTDIEVKTIVVS
jgi:hypothetical protein